MIAVDPKRRRDGRNREIPYAWRHYG